MILVSEAQARALEKLATCKHPTAPYAMGVRFPTLKSLEKMGFARSMLATGFRVWPCKPCRYCMVYEITEEGRAALPHLEYICS